MAITKRKKAIRENVTAGKIYPLQQALELLKKISSDEKTKLKFEEMVIAIICLPLCVVLLQFNFKQPVFFTTSSSASSRRHPPLLHAVILCESRGS